MKRTVLFLLAGILTIIVVECNRATPVSPSQTITLTPGPGAFGLGYMKGLSKSTANAAVKSGANVSFNLGSIKGSTAFYFLLYNIGSTPITDVNLSIADTQFAVYPSAMDTLIPGGDVGMLPVVKVSAYHGAPLDGPGNRPLMDKGLNSATLRISGVTQTAKGKDTTVTLSAILDLQALVMDFKLFGWTGPVDFANPTFHTIAGIGSAINLPDNTVLTAWNGYFPANYNYDLSPSSNSCYTNDFRDTVMKLSNIGNVDIRVNLYISGQIWSLNAVVAAGDSIFIDKPVATYAIDGNHTVADPKKIIFQDDGRFYFKFSLPDAPTCGQTNQTKINIDLNPFFTMSKASACADKANQLFQIDTTIIFWNRQGTCPGNFYSYTLFSAYSVDSILCRSYDSLAGPQELCSAPKYHDMLDTIVANLSDPALGLGNSHRVIPFPIK
jgi:hypothetical protein